MDVDALLVAMEPAVRKLAGRYTYKLRVDVDDLVQVGLIAIWRKLPEHDPARYPLHSYLMAVAKFAFIDHARSWGGRKQQRHRRSVPLSVLSHGQTEMEFASREYLPDDDGFEYLLSGLTERSKALLRMRYQEGLDVTQMAAKAHMRRSNVSLVCSKALWQLKRKHAA